MNNNTNLKKTLSLITIAILVITAIGTTIAINQLGGKDSDTILTNEQIKIFYTDEAVGIAEYNDDSAEPQGWELFPSLYWDANGNEIFDDDEQMASTIFPTVHFTENAQPYTFCPLHQSIMDQDDAEIVSAGWISEPNVYASKVKDNDELVTINSTISIYDGNNYFTQTLNITSTASTTMTDVVLTVYLGMEIQGFFDDYAFIDADNNNMIKAKDNETDTWFGAYPTIPADSYEISIWDDGPSDADDLWQHCLQNNLNSQSEQTGDVEGALQFNLDEIEPGESKPVTLYYSFGHNENELYPTPSNTAPYTPIRPYGPTPVYAESGWNYLTSTTDPEGHQLFYKWDWGDEISGWIGPFDSGIMVSESHTWTTPGDYNVKVKAKDDPDGNGDPSDGLESDWSEPLLVTVRKPGDANGDGVVNVDDLLSLLASWGDCPGDSSFPWVETFDSYANGSGMHGQGGWAGWDYDPAFDANVSNDQSRSNPHSVDIRDVADIVHEYSGATSGQWIYTTYIYVPEEMDSQSYFILLNTYPADIQHPENWSTQIELDGATGVVREYNGQDIIPLITNQWTEIRVEIDLDQDEQHVYYNNILLVNESWSEGVAPGGAINIAAVDLFANGSPSVYYDDMSLEVSLCAADFNGDGVVDVNDLLILLANWG